MNTNDDYVRGYVDELLRTGLTLVDLLTNLIESLPENEFPGDESGEVLISMLTETIRPAATAAGERAVRETTALLGASAERTLSDLRAAAGAASDDDAT